MSNGKGLRDHSDLLLLLDKLENGSSEERKLALAVFLKKYTELDCHSLIRLYKIVSDPKNDQWVSACRQGKTLRARLS